MWRLLIKNENKCISKHSDSGRIFGQLIIQINKAEISFYLPVSHTHSFYLFLAAPGVALIGAQLLLAAAAATATAAAISTQWLFLPLTFQYGRRKLTRYKMATDMTKGVTPTTIVAGAGTETATSH